MFPRVDSGVCRKNDRRLVAIWVGRAVEASRMKAPAVEGRRMYLPSELYNALVASLSKVALPMDRYAVAYLWRGFRPPVGD